MHIFNNCKASKFVFMPKLHVHFNNLNNNSKPKQIENQNYSPQPPQWPQQI